MTQLWKIVEGLNCSVAVLVLADVGVGVDVGVVVDGTWPMENWSLAVAYVFIVSVCIFDIVCCCMI